MQKTNVMRRDACQSNLARILVDKAVTVGHQLTKQFRQCLSKPITSLTALVSVFENYGTTNKIRKRAELNQHTEDYVTVSRADNC